MRIGFDAKRAFLNSTGLGNYCRSTINALHQFAPSNEYLLYTPTKGSGALYQPPGETRICLPSTLWAKQLKSYWRTYGITRRAVKDKLDLYHGLSNEIPVGIEQTHVKSVVTIHDVIFMRLPELYAPIDRRIYRKKWEYAVRNADRIIAISSQTKDDLVELLGADENKIRLVFQGCNPWFYHPKEKEELERIQRLYNLPEQYLLYVGTIEKRKNLLNIVRAIHEYNIDVPLVAIGRKTTYFDKIEEYIASNRIRNITVIPHVPNQDLPGLYQQASAFVYPSSYEGFGIPVLEALNSGIPVITSKGGCLEETAGPGGMFVVHGNVEMLAEAIQKVLEDSSLREKMIIAGKEHALHFREDKTIPQLLNVYKECII